MSQALEPVRAHVRAHFGGHEPDSASVTFLGTETIEVLRFRTADGLVHYVSLGCSRGNSREMTPALNRRRAARPDGR